MEGQISPFFNFANMVENEHRRFENEKICKRFRDKLRIEKGRNARNLKILYRRVKYEKEFLG